jgi:hypothetical protein
MRIYILRFRSEARLHEAFDRVLGSPEVLSCMVEAAEARIRFLAPASEADALVESIYLGGGLVWCSRHDIDARPERSLVAPEDAAAPPRA